MAFGIASALSVNFEIRTRGGWDYSHGVRCAELAVSPTNVCHEVLEAHIGLRRQDAVTRLIRM